MNRHPGGEAQTLHLLENIEWKKEMKALDLGAGEGDTVRILKSFGLEAHGVDLFPRGSDVEIGDFLHLQYSSDSIDLCISQCAFFVSRDQKKAVSECWRVLKKGGFLYYQIWIPEIFWKWQNRQGLPFSDRRIRRYFGGNIIWKQSGMIRSAATSISSCRKSIKERSCAIPCWLAERSSTWIFMKES